MSITTADQEQQTPVSTPPIAVQIRHLTKVMGRKTIVDQLSLDIPRGEVFGFLGPNGAGKTTTIRMMVGLTSPTKGKVLIAGIDVSTHFAEAMMHVGAIVENPEMYKYLTGYQNLRHFARMSPGVTNERIDQVVRLVGLEQRIQEKVRTYSLGMRQRLGLAQALLRKPDVLILDEPTNGLDPAGIRELRDHLRTLAREEGLAVVVSSHLLSEMELMCDRVAIIQAGKLVDVRAVGDRAGVDEPSETSPWTVFEVNDVPAAVRVLVAHFPDCKAKPGGAADGFVEATLARSDIPQAVAQLTAEHVAIFGIRSVTRSLEETFLELTGGGPIVSSPRQ
ncbi:MAG: ABC transporter ATP-binding protein [Alicyclobacillaceae bacterium]|nr:ABC transporter ATP-binding protein [Alicyclobacillaceae bacterium]